MISRLLLLLSLFVGQAAAHGHMSRHLRIDDLSMVVIMADAATTQGPYDEEDDDYVYTSDLTAAAYAGSPGVDEDRAKVLDGIPINITFTVYDLSNSADGYANEYEDVEVYMWHCDTTGVYSAVDSSRQSVEGTDGQVWLRAYQVTGSDGTVTFQTIIPGWYTQRVTHYHIRLRFQGTDYWAATSQLFFNDTSRALYENIEPYASDTYEQTDLSDDIHYNSLDSDVAEMLVVNLEEGSVETGFSISYKLGILPTDEWSESDINVGSGNTGNTGGNTGNNGGNGGNGGNRPGRNTPAPTAVSVTTPAPTSAPVTSTFAPTLAPVSPTTTSAPTSAPSSVLTSAPTSADISSTASPTLAPTTSVANPTSTTSSAEATEDSSSGAQLLLSTCSIMVAIFLGIMVL